MSPVTTHPNPARSCRWRPVGYALLGLIVAATTACSAAPIRKPQAQMWAKGQPVAGPASEVAAPASTSPPLPGAEQPPATAAATEREPAPSLPWAADLVLTPELRDQAPSAPKRVSRQDVLVAAWTRAPSTAAAWMGYRASSERLTQSAFVAELASQFGSGGGRHVVQRVSSHESGPMTGIDASERAELLHQTAQLEADLGRIGWMSAAVSSQLRAQGYFGATVHAEDSAAAWAKHAALAKQVLASARELYEGGRARYEDVLGAQSRYERLVVERDAARRGVLAAKAQLAAELGWDAPPDSVLPSPPPDTGRCAELDPSVAHRGVDAVRAEWNQYRAERLAALSGARLSDAPLPASAQSAAARSLSDEHRGAGAVVGAHPYRAELIYRASQARYAAQEARAKGRAEWRRALADWAGARDRWDWLTQREVDRSRRRWESALESYRSGAGTFADLDRALAHSLQVELDVAAVRRDAWAAVWRAWAVTLLPLREGETPGTIAPDSGSSLPTQHWKRGLTCRIPAEATPQPTAPAESGGSSPPQSPAP